MHGGKPALGRTSTPAYEAFRYCGYVFDEETKGIMKKESIRIPGKAPFVFVATVSGMIILTFMVLAVI